LIIGLFILSGMKKISADPPHVGLLTKWGEKKPIIYNEGWIFLFLKPIFLNVIEINVKKRDKVTKIDARPSDLSEISMPITITWSPNCEDGQDLINFVDNGKHESIEERLNEMISQRIREWLASENEGPETWMEARAAGELAAMAIVKRIVKDNLDKIPSDIPTEILLKFYDSRKPNNREKERWGEHWGKVESKINLLEPAEKNKLEEALEKRREIIRGLLAGSSNLKNHSLGVRIHRLTIGEVKVLGEVAKAAEQEAKEEAEKNAEKREIEGVMDRITQLSYQLKIPASKANEIVEIERGKITKNIQEFQINLSEDTLGALEKIFKGLLSKIIWKGDK